jgi:hypothetical protein
MRARLRCPVFPLLLGVTLFCLPAFARVNPGVDSNSGSGAPACGCRPFPSPIDYLPGMNAAWPAVGDFNGDGILDVVAVTNAQDLTVLLGRKNGTFLQGGSFPGVFGALAVGDFNGDGKLDVASAGYLAVNVLLGNGDGTFQAAKETSINLGIDFIAAGDFNHDGKLDLAAVGSGSSVVLVMLGNGDGTFQPPATYPVDAWPTSIAVADFNRDGSLDLAVSSWGNNESGNTVSVLFGKPDGTFLPKSDYTVGNAPYTVIAVDLNGDGWPDLATADFVSGTASVLLNKGDGTFLPSTSYTTGHPRAPYGIAAAPLEAGSKPSLAVATVAGTYILENNGDGTFQPARGYEPSSTEIIAADFNGDGNADLMLAGNYEFYGQDGLTILFGSGNAVFDSPAAYPLLPELDMVANGDFNGDGRTDLVIGSNEDNLIGVMLGEGKGRFSQPIVYYSVQQPVAIAVGDVNGDGKLDLAVVPAYGDQVLIMLGNGDGTFNPGPPVNAEGASFLTVLKDLNHDGILDLVTVSSNIISGENAVAIFLGNGDGTFRDGPTYPLPSNPTYDVGWVVTDLNGDGNPDLAITESDTETHESVVEVFLGNGDGTFRQAGSYAAGTMALGLVSGDFNGDGKLDLATINQATNRIVKILWGSGDGSFHSGPSLPVFGDAYEFVAGDFSRGGTADLAVTSNQGGLVKILLGDGRRPPIRMTSPIGGNPGQPLAADLNGDGAVDLAVPNSEGGELSILLNRCPRK